MARLERRIKKLEAGLGVNNGYRIRLAAFLGMDPATIPEKVTCHEEALRWIAPRTGT
jgi:hypothetical protein